MSDEKVRQYRIAENAAARIIDETERFSEKLHAAALVAASNRCYAGHVLVTVEDVETALEDFIP